MNSFKSFKILVSFWVQVLERQERPGVVLLPLMVFQKHTSFWYFCITSILVLLDNHIIFLYRMFSLVQDVMEKAWEIRCTQLKQLVLCDLCLACFRCWIVFRKFWQWLFLAQTFLLIQYLTMLIWMGKKKTTKPQANIQQCHSCTHSFLFSCDKYTDDNTWCIWWYLPLTPLLESDKLLHRFLF